MNRRSFLLACAAAGLASGARPSPGHPRLYFRAEHLDMLRERLGHPTLAKAVARVRATAAAGATGANYDRVAEIARSRALLSVLTGDEDLGRAAVRLIAEQLPSFTWDTGILDISRRIGLAMLSVGMVYDWCFPYLDGMGPLLIEHSYRLARMFEVGYPPTGQGAITGHAGEAMLLRDLLGTGVAIYDESPEMFEVTSGRIMREFVPARDFFYRSGVHHQGSAYGPYRYRWEVIAAFIYERAGIGNPFSRDQGEMPYRWIYTERPDGRIMPEGDVFQGRPVTPAYLAAAGLYQDPYIQDRFLAMPDALDQDPIELIVLWNPDLQRKPVSELPVARHFPSPYSGTVVRTGWDADAAIFEFKVKEWHFNNHQHLDAGAFQIYMHGPLALDSGLYRIYFTPHDGNYLKRTVAHNAMLVGEQSDAKVAGRWVFDGGQRWPNEAREPRTLADLQQRGYRVAHTIGQQIQYAGDRVDWAYLEGDLTDAYLRDQVEQYRRAFVYLDGGTLVILDRIRSAHPEMMKRWLLHTAGKPEVTETGTTSGNGRAVLTHHALLPVERRIDILGGPGAEFTVWGQNYVPDIQPQPVHEAGEWRVEVVSSDGIFLNVLTAGTGSAPTAQLLQAGSHTGVVTGDRVVVFMALGDDELQFNLPERDGGYKCLAIAPDGTVNAFEHSGGTVSLPRT